MGTHFTGRDHNPQTPPCLGLRQWTGNGNDREIPSHLPGRTSSPGLPLFPLGRRGLQSLWRLGLETMGVTVDAQSCTNGLGLLGHTWIRHKPFVVSEPIVLLGTVIAT